MSNPFQNELKKEFQLERMILFSDAVFAIAITLLALEIKVPEITKDLVSDHLLIERLSELIPKFVGFLVSFLVIAIYRVVHHRTFGYVINYNPRLLWPNLFFLLAVILMPFSSGFYSGYLLTPAARLPVIIYVVRIVFLGTMSLIIWEYIANPKHRLSEGITREIKKIFPLSCSSASLRIYTYRTHLSFCKKGSSRLDAFANSPLHAYYKEAPLKISHYKKINSATFKKFIWHTFKDFL